MKTNANIQEKLANRVDGIIEGFVRLSASAVSISLVMSFDYSHELIRLAL